MSEDRPNLGTIGLCAIVGALMAGVTLGILMTVPYIGYSDGLSQAVLTIATGALSGGMLATGLGSPIGLVIGLIVSRWIGRHIAHAALAGALTGAVYPTFFLVSGLVMGADGISGLAELSVFFVGLGAACGAAAHWLVIDRAIARIG